MRETEERQVRSLGREDPLEKGLTAHSSILAWRIPWTEEPGGLQSMESQRVGQDWVTNTFIFTIFHCIYVPHLYSFILFSLTCIISLNFHNSLCGGFHPADRGGPGLGDQARLLLKPSKVSAMALHSQLLILKGELSLSTFSFRKKMLGLTITLDHKSQTSAI